LGILPKMRVLVVLAAFAAIWAAAGPGRAATVSPDIRTTWTGTAFHDTELSPAASARLDAKQQIAEWGGPTTAADGESVSIYLSDTYPQDPALQAKWANLMTSLVHGPELQTVSIHLAPLVEVQRFCGGGALACYSTRTNAIYAPAEDPAPDVTAVGALIHEFGHHIAATRLNPPFTTVDYGTKRWASYENVCAKAQSGSLFPGAEDDPRYQLNPGEAFAESYRVLNEQMLGLPVDTWDIVTASLYPDATALSLLEQDILSPWTANTASKLATTLSSKVPTHTLTFSTPLDGSLLVSPRQSAKATSVIVSLVAKGKTIGSSSFTGPAGRLISKTICGVRSYQLRVALGGKVTKATITTVSLTLSKP
jgi:hypothetical protein